MATENNNTSLTKAQRREQARAKARELKEAEIRRAKRTRLTVIGVAVVAIIAVVAAVAFIVIDGNKKAAGVTPEGYETNAAIVVGKGDGGIAEVGKTNANTPTVTIYSDYMCTHCNDLEKQFGNQLFNLAAEGKITLETHPISILGSSFSTTAAQVDYYVALNAPKYYAAYRSTMFTDVTEPVFTTTNTEPDTSAIVDVATKVGMPSDVISGIKDVIKNQTYATFIENQATAFTDAGFTGTPTVLVNGTKYDDWTKVIDKAQEAAGTTWTLSGDTPKHP